MWGTPGGVGRAFAWRIRGRPGVCARRHRLPVAGSSVADAKRARADRVLLERFAEQRDPVDRELLVERFLPLARSIATRYVRRTESFDDVFQVACLGLVNAIDRYDVGRGRAFSSFAVPTIAGEIKRYSRDRTWSVNVPATCRT